MPEVYGEETIEVDISRGLWLGAQTREPDPFTSGMNPFTNDFFMPWQEIAPEGFASFLLNLVKTKRGTWIPRDSFKTLGPAVDTTNLVIQESGYKGADAFAVQKEDKATYWLPAYKENMPVLINLATRTLYNYKPVSGTSGGSVSEPTKQYNAFAQTYQPRTFTLYKDRMYACNAAGAWYRITGWGAFTTGTVTLTETLLPGANNNNMSNITGIFAVS